MLHRAQATHYLVVTANVSHKINPVFCTSVQQTTILSFLNSKILSNVFIQLHHKWQLRCNFSLLSSFSVSFTLYVYSHVNKDFLFASGLESPGFVETRKYCNRFSLQIWLSSCCVENVFIKVLLKYILCEFATYPLLLNSRSLSENYCVTKSIFVPSLIVSCCNVLCNSAPSN